MAESGTHYEEMINASAHIERPIVQVTWKDLRVEVPKAIQPDGSPRVVLNDVTGGVRPGVFLAIMGPSGAGKTTFLNSISNRDLGKGVEKTAGIVAYNSNDIHTFNVMSVAGFVP